MSQNIGGGRARALPLHVKDVERSFRDVFEYDECNMDWVKIQRML